MSATLEVPALPKIGLISKQVHCKPHLKAMTDLGYEVVLLGGNPSSVPPSIEVVVLRMASSSHCASDAALAWNRATGKPLLRENGVSGLRKRLKEMREGPAVPVAATEVDAKFARALSLQREAHPESSDEDCREVLRRAGASEDLVAQLVPATVVTALTRETIFPGEYPAVERWAVAAPEQRLREESWATYEIWRSTPLKVRETVAQAYLTGLESGGDLFPPSNVWRSKGWGNVAGLFGRPHRFLQFLMRCLPKEQAYYGVDLQKTYMQFTQKRTDMRIARAAAWVTGRTLRKGQHRRPPASDVVPVAPESEAPQRPSSLIEAADAPPVEDPVQKVKEHLEAHILELMDKNGSLTKLVSQTRKEAEGFRVTMSRDFTALKSAFTDEIITLRRLLDATAPALAHALTSLKENQQEIAFLREAVDHQNTALRERGAAIISLKATTQEDLGVLNVEAQATRINMETLASRMDSVQEEVSQAAAPAASLDLLGSLAALKGMGASLTIKMGDDSAS